jgi:hypothetical protein
MEITVNGWSWDPTEDGGAGAWTAKTGPTTWTIVKADGPDDVLSFTPPQYAAQAAALAEMA